MYRPVEAHEDEGPNAGASGDDDEVLHDLAPNVTERPVRQYEIGRGERNAKQNEEQIGDREIRYQNVRRRAHAGVRENHHDHQAVTDQAEDAYGTEEQRDHDTDDALDQLAIVTRSELLASRLIGTVARTADQRHVQHRRFEHTAPGHVPTRVAREDSRCKIFADWRS